MIKTSKMLWDFHELLFTKGHNSYSEIRQIPICEFEKLLEEEGILASLKEDLHNFLELLFCEDKTKHFHNMVLLSPQMDDFGLYPDFLLSYYCQSHEAYRNHPLLFYKLVQKLDLEEFKEIPLERYYDAFRETFAMKERKKGMCEVLPSKKYNDYKEEFLVDNLQEEDLDDITKVFMWAEKQVFEMEKEKLKGTPYEDQVVWVSKDYGDGFGYDILSYDLESGKEKLIEVKSGHSDSVILTRNEHCLLTLARDYDVVYEIKHFHVLDTSSDVPTTYRPVPFEEIKKNHLDINYYRCRDIFYGEKWALSKINDNTRINENTLVLKKVLEH